MRGCVTPHRPAASACIHLPLSTTSRQRRAHLKVGRLIRCIDGWNPAKLE